jgi:hypothetical protein
MAALKAAVVVMGVLIVAGFALLVGVLVSRVGGGSSSGRAVPVAATLDEPAGTRIASVAASAERLVVSLQGGGPDRVVVLDLRDGRVLARATLMR